MDVDCCTLMDGYYWHSDRNYIRMSDTRHSYVILYSRTMTVTNFLVKQNNNIWTVIVTIVTCNYHLFTCSLALTSPARKQSIALSPTSRRQSIGAPLLKGIRGLPDGIEIPMRSSPKLWVKFRSCCVSE